MLSKTNIEERLHNVREKRIDTYQLMHEVHELLKQEFHEVRGPENSFNFEKLNPERIYHLNDIQNICVTYRLRFLNAHFFKGPFPMEAVEEIQHLEELHETSVSHLKIMAPAKLLKLENADDPLLFAPLGNDYYYLIHKWGNDLHPLRKLLMWPFKNFENIILTIFVMSIILTAITPMQAFTKGDVTQTEYILMFLFIFKAVAGITLFYGFAKGKNFNEAIWDSKYYNA